MGDLRFQSVAQRRRAGAPSLHGGTVSGYANQGDMGAALSGMAQVGNPRIPMGPDAIASFLNLSGQPQKGTPVPARPGVAGDPGIFPTAVRTPVMMERGGARYGIRVGIPVMTMPEAAATQANGRVIRGRGTGASFWGA